MPEQIYLPFKEYLISSDKSLLQEARVHHWISTQSYWAQGIPRELVASAIAHSFTSGIYHDGLQIGFSRLITDYTTFGYLADVYVEAAHQGKGLATAMCGAIMQLDWVQRLRRLMLATRDAHAIYAGVGFVPLSAPERLMEIVRPNIYQP